MLKEIKHELNFVRLNRMKIRVMRKFIMNWFKEENRNLVKMFNLGFAFLCAKVIEVLNLLDKFYVYFEHR